MSTLLRIPVRLQTHVIIQSVKQVASEHKILQIWASSFGICSHQSLEWRKKRDFNRDSAEPTGMIISKTADLLGLSLTMSLEFSLVQFQ